MVLAAVFNGNCQVVEYAEPHGAVVACMMSGWPCHRICPPAVEGRLCSHHGAPCSESCNVEGVGGHVGVVVKPATTATREDLKVLHVSAAVDHLDLMDAGDPRLHELDFQVGGP